MSFLSVLLPSAAWDLQLFLCFFSSALLLLCLCSAQAPKSNTQANQNSATSKSIRARGETIDAPISNMIHRNLTGIGFFCLCALPISLLLLLDSYFDVLRYESIYTDHHAKHALQQQLNSDNSSPAAGLIPDLLIDGHALSASRFRAQRNLYISLFATVIQCSLYLTRALLKRYTSLMVANYRLQTRIDAQTLQRQQGVEH